MKRSSVAARLLVGTALCFPFAGAVHSQALVDITEEELAGKSQECQSLAQEYQGDDDPTVVSEDEVITAINDDNAEECARLEEEVSANETQTQQDTTGATVTEQQQTEQTQTETEEVDLSEEATIEGEAEVTVPEPDVDVDVPEPTVQVQQQTPQVNISEAPTELQVQQERPQIDVEIPEIIVRVQIPAPQFYMLEGEPQVEVGTQDPQIQVEQGDPTVDVSQGDPELDLNLSEGESADGQQTDTADAGATGQQQQVGANVDVSDPSQARVVINEAEGEPRVTLQRAEPSLSYESPEPEVRVMMAEQPTVEVEQTGEPSVTVETQEEREQRLQQQQEQQAQQQEQQAQEQEQDGQAADDTATLQSGQAGQESEQAQAETGATGMATEQTGETTAPGDGMMTVSELRDMEVVTAGGENLGNPEAVVEINGEPNIVLSQGGFLGLGAKQVPVSLSRITVENDRLLLDSMTEEDIDAANDFEYDSNLEMSDDEQVSVSGG